MATSQFTITPVARLAFPALATPKANQQGKEKYGCVLLFDKATSNLDELKALGAGVVKEQWPDAAKRPKLRNPVKDGDVPNSMGNIPNGYAGCWVVSCSSNYAPGLVNQQAKKVLDASMFYPGCYVYAQVNAYSYANSGNVGVSFGLSALQFVRDGEKLAGAAPNPESAFRPVSGGSQPGQPAAPAAGDEHMFE